VNGSASSAAALDWSVTWAIRHSMALEVCTALGADWFDDADGYFRQDHQRVLDAASKHVRRLAPDLRATFVLHRGDLIELLAERSACSSLVVVGSRKPGPVTGVLRGTLALKLAGRAVSPLVVVPENWLPGAGRVVVGVDDETDAEAVRFAARAAADSDSPLLLVHAVEQPVYYSPYDFGGRPEIVDELRRMSAATVAGRCDSVRQDHTGLTVTGRVEVSNPSLCLVRNATGASLAVVGSHHRKALAEFILGSVGHDLLVNLPCPVAIVPPLPTTGAQDDDLALTTTLAL
jgi:nucleotide-binding universal stress UspA family protein